MPNNTKISDLDLASQLNEADLLLLSQQESKSEEFDSKKTTVGNLAEKVATEVQFSGLQTEDKTIQGAINEAAEVGKKSEEYTSDSLESETWSGSDCWIDSGETVDEHTVYKSDAGTYGKQAGDSLCSFLVEGYDDVTVYVKQDNIDTNRSYMLLGYANEPISQQYYAERYKGETLTDYAYHHYTYLQGKPTKIEALYHVDSPTVPGSATIDLQDGQWVSTDETIEGHTVYKSHGGSYHINNGSSKCVIEISGVSSFSIFCKPSSESGYDKTYIGKLDATVSKDDSSTYINSFSGNGYNYTEVKYEINDENRHTIEILYAKDSGGNDNDDCGYIYFVKNGAVSESRGYIYLVPGTPHIPLGEIFNNYTDNRALGNYSHAEGSGNYAFGESSHVEGKGNKATATASHAEGSSTLVSYDYAHAEGYGTKATAHAAHAEGNRTLAAGSNTHAEGEGTQALYNYAHAEGYGTTASGPSSHSEGKETTASGSKSHAEGEGTTVSGEASHAEGYRTTVSGPKSHAEGYETVVSGEASHAEGYESQALGYYCHAEGYETIANGSKSHAEGSRNKALGLGSHAEGESTLANGVGAHSEGGYAKALGKYSHAEGSNLASGSEGPNALGLAAHAEGILTKAEGIGSHAEGIPAIKYPKFSSTETYNTGDIVYYSIDNDSENAIRFSRAKVDNIQGISPTDSSAWQYWESYDTSNPSSYLYSVNGYYSSTAIGNGAHAEGILAIAWGEGSHAEGSGNLVSGNCGHAEGTRNTVYSDSGHADGSGNQVYGRESHATGSGNIVSEQSGYIEGAGNRNIAYSAHVEGAGNKNTYKAHISHTEGAGNTNHGYQAHLEGGGNFLSGEESHVEGAGNMLHGHKSHVEGGGNTAYTFGSHIEGKHNTAVGYGHHAEGINNYIGFNGTPGYFSYGTNYKVGDVVGVDITYLGSVSIYPETDTRYLYRCITAPGQIQQSSSVNIITPDIWNSSTTYAAGAVVQLSDVGFYYNSSSESITGTIPTAGWPWNRIYDVLSPFKTSGSGYYMLDCNEVYGVNKIAVVTGEVQPMWEPLSNTSGGHVEGIGNIAIGDYQHVQGKYNTSDANKAFIIGNGTDEDHRSNALTVDWSGNTTIAGDLTTGVTLNTTAQAIGAAINEISVRVPAPPTTDGTYTLSVTISNGVPKYSWYKIKI